MDFIVDKLKDIDFERIDLKLAYLEKKFDKADYFIGFMTGPVRIVFGKVLAVAAIFFSYVNLFLHIAYQNPDPSLLNNARQGAGYAVHGAGDIVKGAVATLNLFGGVFLLLGYNYWIGRFHYEYEEPEPGVETLNPCHPSRPQNRPKEQVINV